MVDETHWQNSISMVAHELRTPLTSLRTLLEVLDARMERPGFEVAKNRSTVKMSLKQTEQALVLINDLLDITRMQKGHLQYEFGKHQIIPLVREILDRIIASHQSHEFDMAITDSRALAMLDPVRFEQALTNIITNAIKYSPAQSTITITAQEEGSTMEIAVTDQGIGITPEQQRHLFELYYRAPGAATVKGLGIGLPLSYEIIKAHGGELRVKSVAGKGSTFTVVIPLLE